MQETATDRLICVQTSLDSAEAAKTLAQALVEARLAACVQVSAITSTYRWQGKVEVADEHLVTVKTMAFKLSALEAFLGANHPYDEPEVLVLPVVAASKGYAAWVRESVG